MLQAGKEHADHNKPLKTCLALNLKFARIFRKDFNCHFTPHFSEPGNITSDKFHNQVFVDEAFVTCANYSTMSILSTTLLHSSAIIDQVYETRTITAHAIANQFYGCFITTEKWSDLWLKKGVSKYLAGLFVKKMFGNNEYRDMIHKEMERVVRYEQRYGGIVLDSHIPPQTVTPSVGQRGGRPERDDRVNVEDTFAFDPSNLNSCSPEWLEVL